MPEAPPDALHVHRYGPSAGPALVALHGITSHGARFRALAEGHLPGRRVLAPDLRGHGRSPALPPWTLERHAADVLAVLDAEGVRRADLLGHSFGGVVALHVARTAPERVASLLLVDPAVFVRPEDALRNAGGAARGVPDREAAVASQRGDWPDVPEEAVLEEVEAHWTESGRGWHPRYLPAAVATGWSELCRDAPTPPPGVPTTVVRALKADFVDEGYLRACADAGAEVELVDADAGHVVYLERPELVAGLVRGGA